MRQRSAQNRGQLLNILCSWITKGEEGSWEFFSLQPRLPRTSFLLYNFFIQPSCVESLLEWLTQPIKRRRHVNSVNNNSNFDLGVTSLRDFLIFTRNLGIPNFFILPWMADTNEQEEMTRNYVNNDSNFDLDVTSVDAIALMRQNFQHSQSI